MIDRPEQLEQLSAYLDGELTAAERADVERLLAADPDARTLLQELRQTSRLVSSLPRGRAPANLAADVIAQLERHALLDGVPTAPRRAWYTRATNLIALAASAALVVTAGWLLFPSLQASKKPIPLANRAEPRPPAAVEHEAAAPEAVATAQRPVDQLSPSAGETRGVSGERIALAPHTSEFSAKAGAEPRRVPVVAKPAGPVAAESPAASSPAAPSFTQFAAKAASPIPATETATPPPTEPSPVVVADYDIGEPALDEAASPSAGQFDSLLQSNVMSNMDVRRASPASLSNRVVLETDSQNRSQLLAYVGSFMESNGVPDVDEHNLPEPIASSQAFYAVQKPEGETAALPSPTPAHADQGAAIGDVGIIMNVTRSQAADLINNLQQLSASNRATNTWTANGLPIEGRDAAPEVLRQLVYANQAEGRAADDAMQVLDTYQHDDRPTAERPPPPLHEKAPAKAAAKKAPAKAEGGRGVPAPAASKGGMTGVKDKRSPAQEEGRSVVTAQKGATTVPTTAPAAGARPREYFQTVAPPDQLVTLALYFRVPQPVGPPAPSPVHPSKEAAILPAGTAVTPAGTSQPTTEGADGG